MGVRKPERAEALLLVWVVAVAGLLLAVPVWAQSVPEIVRPQSPAPTIPPNPADGAAPRPRSENPLTDSGPVRPIPDGGVIAPPVSGLGAPTPVIRPPAEGAMPVIPPPGSPGGDRSVVPK